ncbi:MAG: hypothetical protein K2K53_02350 [Oscillospiraceae bacterium]|nr:hypothetical protein [Oscillospiraceae bacterium]
MNIDKEKLVKNLVIFAILAVVCMAFLRMTSSTDDFGVMIIAGLAMAIMLYLPVRLFPQVGLIGSIIVAVVEMFLFFLMSCFVTKILGETLGAVLGLLILLAAFIASLLFV